MDRNAAPRGGQEAGRFNPANWNTRALRPILERYHQHWIFRVLQWGKVIDGDTVWARIDLGFNVHHFVRLRLMDVDAEERGTEAAEQQRMFLWDALDFPLAQYSVAVDKDRDKYGRYVATIFVLRPFGAGDWFGPDLTNVNHVVRDFINNPHKDT